VLLTTGRYKGNRLLAHFRFPIEERYFAHWLTLFSETANEVMMDSQGQDHHAEGGPYRNEYETGSCIATMTSIWSTFNRL